MCADPSLNNKVETDCLDPEEMKDIPKLPREDTEEILPYLRSFTSGCADTDVYGIAC